MVIDLPLTDNDNKMMLRKTRLKQAQTKHDWGANEITLQSKKKWL